MSERSDEPARNYCRGHRAFADANLLGRVGVERQDAARALDSITIRYPGWLARAPDITAMPGDFEVFEQIVPRLDRAGIDGHNDLGHYDAKPLSVIPWGYLPPPRHPPV